VKPVAEADVAHGCSRVHRPQHSRAEIVASAFKVVPRLREEYATPSFSPAVRPRTALTRGAQGGALGAAITR